MGLQVHFPLCACVCAGIRQPWGGKELGLNSNTPCFAFADTGLCAFPGEKGGGGSCRLDAGEDVRGRGLGNPAPRMECCCC